VLFKGPHGKASYTKIMLVLGWCVITYYVVKYLERILNLPDNFFTQALPYVAGIISAFVGLLSAGYGWSKYLDGKNGKSE